MTKADLVEAVHTRIESQARLSKRDSADLVDSVFEGIKVALTQGDKLKISGFGNFVVREKKPRVGRNPRTGQEITITERRVLTFKASQVLKAALNAA
jgi:integration host factor subunit alpha